MSPLDATEHGLFAGGVARGEHFRQHRLVRAGLDEAAREDCLDFGSEADVARRIVQ